MKRLKIIINQIWQMFKKVWTIFAPFFAHFKTIKASPYKFVLWIVTSIFLSLSSYWIPYLLGEAIGKSFYCQLMANNPFVIFSIVFLSNSVLTSINHVGAGSNDVAVSIRGITLVLTIMYLIFLSAIIPLKLVSNISLSHQTQWVLLFVTIVFGIYVYGFREKTWESSVDDVRQREEGDVESIAARANNLNDTGENIEL